MTGVTRYTIYAYIRRWWQGGQTKNALLPHYGNCGSARDGSRCAAYRKLGHPSRISKHEMRPTGVNVDEKWRKVITTGARMFYENREGQSFSEAYRMTLDHFCKKGFKVENGVKKPILPDVNEVFSSPHKVGGRELSERMRLAVDEETVGKSLRRQEESRLTGSGRGL